MNEIDELGSFTNYSLPTDLADALDSANAQITALRAELAEALSDVGEYECKLERAHHMMAENHARTTKVAAERDAARAELEGVRRDAERYRYLRTHAKGKRLPWGEQVFDLPHPTAVSNIMHGSVAEHLDAAIDALQQKE